MQKLISEEISFSSLSNSFVNFSDKDKKTGNRKVCSKDTSISESLVSESRTIEPEENCLGKQQPKNKRVTFPDDFENLSLDDSDGDQSVVSIRTTSSIVDNKVFKRKIIRYLSFF